MSPSEDIYLVFEQTGLLEHIDRAIDLTKSEVSRLPATHPSRAQKLVDLAGQLKTRASRHRMTIGMELKEKDLRDAIKYSQEATRLASTRNLIALSRSTTASAILTLLDYFPNTQDYEKLYTLAETNITEAKKRMDSSDVIAYFHHWIEGRICTENFEQLKVRSAALIGLRSFDTALRLLGKYDSKYSIILMGKALLYALLYQQFGSQADKENAKNSATEAIGASKVVWPVERDETFLIWMRVTMILA